MGAYGLGMSLGGSWWRIGGPGGRYGGEMVEIGARLLLGVMVWMGVCGWLVWVDF